MSTSSSFEQLSQGAIRWIYRQGWQSLRAAQEKAIPVVLSQRNDVLITAPTAGGKTEAAFLPVVSWLERNTQIVGYGALCISPLKALINDQFKRLSPMCESAQTEITPWHGDVSQGVKKRSWASAKGVLMITPESLEAMFVRRPHELAARVGNLGFVVIDEFHAFIDRERGMQLLSLLARLEQLIGRVIPRIALSATIGDPQIALDVLRPNQALPGIHVDATEASMNIRLALKAFLLEDAQKVGSIDRMAQELFGKLRGTSNLVFANNRRTVEEMTDRLASLCEEASLPCEFFAHHGSLSKDARHFLENRLKEGEKPTTAIATSTLELGLDIGDVSSVAQVGAPANVSSIRQRLGRSGRREGQPSILRVMVTAKALQPNPTPPDLLEIELFQAIAVLELMLERWIEPPDTGKLHFSTLVQQILSIIAARGDVTASLAFQILCTNGPWRNIDSAMFAKVLRALGQNNVIMQLPTSELIVGTVGEKVVSSHTFYTAFDVSEEYRLFANGRLLGSIPVTVPYMIGQLLLFGGRRWEIEAIDVDTRVMSLKPAKGGQAPTFAGDAAPVHKKIRERMLHLYQSVEMPGYCDKETSKLIQCARNYFRTKEIAISSFVSSADETFWFVWDSDKVINTLEVLVNLAGYSATRYGPCLTIAGVSSGDFSINRIKDVFNQIEESEIITRLPIQPLGKFDEFLSTELQRHGFVAEVLDFAGTREFLDNKFVH